MQHLLFRGVHQRYVADLSDEHEPFLTSCVDDERREALMKTITNGLLASAAACLAVPTYSQSLAREFSFERLDEPTAVSIGPESMNARQTRFSTMQGTVGDGAGLSFARFGNEQLTEGSVAAREDEQQIRTAANEGGAEEGKRKRGIEEIIVTAQRREEHLQDVPMSITAMSSEELIRAGISNVQDLAWAVPGMMVSESGGGRQSIAIRGIFNHRGDSALTGMYLDELPVSAMLGGGTRLGGEGADLRTLDLQRIEVLKGPQGTLFGEGAAGGVIRFITKDPDLSAVGGEVSAKLYDTHDGGDSQEIEGIFNLPMAKNVFGIRIAAAYGNTSGWIDTPGGVPAAITPAGPAGPSSVGRENINDSEVKHARVKALFMPMPQLHIMALVEVHRNEGGGSNFVNRLPYKNSEYVPGFHPDSPTPYTDDYDMYNLTGRYDLGFAELLSSTSYIETDHVRALGYRTIPEEPAFLQIFLAADKLNATIFNQELRLTSATVGPFHWTVGAAYKDAERVFGTGPEGINTSALGGASTQIGANANLRDTTQSESLAAFSDVSYELSDRFEIGGGFRYFEDARKNFNASVPGVVPFSADFDKVTWRVVAKYKPSEDINVYANVGTGFRSGIFNGSVARAAGFPAGVGPEEVTSYEIGTKMSLLDRRVNFNAAAYFSEYDGLQSTINILHPNPAIGGTLQINSNAQFAEIKGIEADIRWAATEGLSLSVAGERTDTEIVRVVPSATPQPYGVGDPINLIPEYSLSMTVDYQFEWAYDLPGLFAMSFNRQGESHYAERASGLYLPGHRITSAPEKDFLNASIGGEWKGWQLTVFGRNLLDERDILSPYAGGIWTPQARPRTFGVVVRKGFQ